MKFKTEIILLLSAIGLYIVSAACYSYEATQPGVLSGISYPYRNYAIPVAGVASVLLVIAAILYSKRKWKLRKEYEVLQDRKVFFVIFAIAGFVMKIVMEFFHEVVGHGLFVSFFGGTVKNVHISIWWPYDFSYISWVPPSSLNYAQVGWIDAGGILVCAYAAFMTLAFLFFMKKVRWHFAVPLFWFAFWGLIGSTGYLILGGLSPFGDVSELIKLGVLTTSSSLVIGLAVFAVGFIISPWILRRLLTEVFSSKRASYGVTLFWLMIPTLVVVMLANPERGMQLLHVPLAFIPALLSYGIEHFLFLSKQKSDTNPNDIAKEQSHD